MTYDALAALRQRPPVIGYHAEVYLGSGELVAERVFATHREAYRWAADLDMDGRVTFPVVRRMFGITEDDMRPGGRRMLRAERVRGAR